MPSRVKLGFAPPLTQAVAPALAPLVRVFARADRSPDIILTTATYGTVVLRDGCFRIGTAPGAPLVLFGRNMALGLDDAGYMEVRSSADPEQRGRVGERFVWGGYPPAIESEPDVKVLRARCGVAPIVSIGEPQSARAFRARANVIDAYATAKRITRQAAWEEIKACWAREDAWVARRRSSSARPQQRQCDQAEID